MEGRKGGMSVATAPSMCPFSPDVVSDPYAHLEAARAVGPVVKLPDTAQDWMISFSDSPVYLVTGFKEASYVLEHPDHFPSGNKTGPPEPPEVMEILKQGVPKVDTLYASDGKDHMALRNLIAPALSPSVVKRWEHRSWHWARTIGASISHNEPINIVSEFCDPVASRAMLDLLGVPEEDHQQIRTWNSQWMKVFIPGYSLKEQCEAAEQLVSYQHYVADLAIKKRDKEPEDTVLSRLVHAETPDGGMALTMPQVVSSFSELYAAGYGNTKEALANLLYLLWARGHWDEVVAQPEHIEGAVEEALRLEGPVQWLSRESAEDTTLGGVTIPRGATIVVSYAAADRDPAVFPQPGDLQIERAGTNIFGTRHVAHGRGPHFCVGATWSKSAMRICLDYLTQTYPEARPEGQLAGEFEAPAPMLRYIPEITVKLGEQA